MSDLVSSKQNRAEILERLRKIGADVKETTTASLTDAQLEQVATAMERVKCQFIHMQDKAEAHRIIADTYRMEACPFCRKRLFPLMEA